MRGRPVIIAYDVASARIRRRVRKRLAQWRIDGQKSLCECLLTEDQAQELFIQLGGELDPETDRLLLAFVQPASAAPKSLRKRLIHVG